MTKVEKARLDSWKDIAQYLGRDLSTVRRWEKEKGLPVHRIPGGLRHAVFAYREEIDEWLSGAGRTVNESAPEPPPRSHWKLASALVLLALVILAVTAAVLSKRRPGNPVQTRFAGDAIIAEGAENEILWKYAFPSAVRTQLPGDTQQLIHVVDVDGDGRREVLVAPPFEDESRYALYCLNFDGKLRWSYVPEATWRFGDCEYARPWQFTDLAVVEHRRQKEIWAGIVHHTWWPSYVVRLNSQGQAKVALVSSGWVTDLEVFSGVSGTFVLAGGINNEYNAAALAVLRPDDPPVTSPQTHGTQFACEACPGAHPFRYLVFGQSELSQITRSNYNTVRNIRKLGDTLEIRTNEVSGGAGEGQSVFELSANFEVRAASMTDLYWAEHRRLEATGQLKHTMENCPDRLKGRRVQVWDPQMQAVYVKPADSPRVPK